MSEIDVASAPEPGALAEGSEPGGGEQPTGLGRLEQFFAADDSDIDNSTPTDDDAEGADEGQEQPDGEEPEPADDKADADTPPDDAAAPDGDDKAGEEEGEEADEAIETEYLTTAEEVKAKFPRNSSNDLVALTAKFGAEAKAGAELKAAIGGDHFITPIKTIAKGLQDGNPAALFEGVVQGNGIDGMAEVMGQAAYMGLVGSVKMLASDNPVDRALGEATKSIVESALQERLGPTITLEKLDRFAQYEAAGWFEKIDKWTEENYVSKDELDELLETTNNPSLLAANQKIKELEAKLGGEKKDADGLPAAGSSQIDNSFSKLTTDTIQPMLTEVALKTSVLRDIASDSPDIAAAKKFLRGGLLNATVAEFNNSTARKDLLDGYRQGKSETAVYKTKFAEALDRAILATSPQKSEAEKIIAALYGKSPNSRLAKKQTPQADGAGAPAGGDAPPQTPTEGTDFGKGKKLTGSEIFKNLEQRLAAREAG